ncbi:MAG TPA: sterol desaturase family protein, partial [Hyphomicrobiaceae bacterium]
MTDLLLTNEPWVRLAAFSGVFAAMAFWELWLPRRQPTIGRGRRWPANLGVVALDTLIVRILFPAAAVGVALACEARGWGLL